jgi:hypothetical protein
MHSPIPGLGRESGKAVLIILGLTVPALATAQGDYLDMLDAYSDEISEPGGTPVTDAENSRGSFENQLRRNFKGSYVLYTKLPEESKQMVYNKYRETGKVADVRSFIVKLYAQRKSE